MGTRSLTTIYEDGKPLLTLYRQFDGYPTGHGAELQTLLVGIRITNGIPVTANIPKLANGAGCLAAQVVAAFKVAPGNFYVVKGEKGHGEDWRYGLWPAVGEPLRLTVDRIDGRYVGKNRWVEKPVRVYDGLLDDFQPDVCERREE